VAGLLHKLVTIRGLKKPVVEGGVAAASNRLSVLLFLAVLFLSPVLYDLTGSV
jgi:hypothetical protein